MKFGDLLKEKKEKYNMKLVPFLVKTVIAPHGITDIGHSIITNNTSNLLKIYGINFGITNLVIHNFDNNYIMTFFLVLSSIIHFRHDFPRINLNNFEIPRYLLACTSLLLFYVLNPDLLIYYMVFFHVPNHFKLNHFHIEKLKIFNVFMYFGITLLCFYLDTNYHEKLNNISIIDNIESIIISHVIYQEKYIINKKN